ncbi:MAG: NADPH-dependent F420 reductase [Chlorobiales bacterium]|nr:NADPH-dependent F420 reductase [Chlorobiales bacterium]
MKIAFIGIGKVGSALAGNLSKAGHEVTVGARDPYSENVLSALEHAPQLKVMTIRDAVISAEVVFLATPFEANKEALLHAGSLNGKIIVDCTNPIGPGLTHLLKSEISGGESVQKLVPEAMVVKAFTIYGYENFIDSHYPGYGTLKPAMLIAGNDDKAKTTVAELCKELGWEPIDTGDISMSLHLEHMTLLWIKMVHMKGFGTGLTWAMLTRR